MSKRLKKSIIWAIYGFVLSFLFCQGLDLSSFGELSFLEILKVAYGTPKFAYRGPVTALIFFVIRYFLFYEKEKED